MMARWPFQRPILVGLAFWLTAGVASLFGPRTSLLDYRSSEPTDLAKLEPESALPRKVQPEGGTMCLLQLGDSITQQYRGDFLGYRWFLFRHLVDAGVFTRDGIRRGAPVRFVGSMTRGAKVLNRTRIGAMLDAPGACRMKVSAKDTPLTYFTSGLNASVEGPEQSAKQGVSFSGSSADTDADRRAAQETQVVYNYLETSPCLEGVGEKCSCPPDESEFLEESRREAEALASGGVRTALLSAVTHPDDWQDWLALPPRERFAYKGVPYPARHEGHGGWLAGNLLHGHGGRAGPSPSGPGSLEQWWPAYGCKPTCVLLHIGTNDMSPIAAWVAKNKGVRWGGLVKQTLVEIRKIIDFIRGKEEEVRSTRSTILVASPIPTCHDTVGLRLGPALASRFSRDIKKNDSQIHLVRMHSTPEDAYDDSNQTSTLPRAQDYRFFLNPLADTLDRSLGRRFMRQVGCHPNARGARKIADLWFHKMKLHGCVES